MLSSNLISGVWTNAPVANGHIQERGEGKEVEKHKEGESFVDDIDTSFWKSFTEENFQLWKTNNRSKKL
jgi:hypothetical protein